jgi:integrase
MANRKVGLCIKIWTPSKGDGRKTRLERDEAVRLLDAAKKGDPHIALFTVILFCTGARHHAITELEWDRIDFLDGTIDFEVDEEFNPMSRSFKKGRAKVLMSRVAREMLMAAYVGRQTKFVIEHGGKRVKDCRGGFANAVKRAGLAKKVTPHTIRHTVVSWLQDEPDIQTRHTSQLVGHVDEATTRLHYTHMSPEALRKVVDVLDGVFDALPTSEAEEAEKQRSEEQFRAILSRLGRDLNLPSKTDNQEN